MLVAEIAVYDALHDTKEMGLRFDTVLLSRWGFDADFLTLLDSWGRTFRLPQPPISWLALARMIRDPSEGLIGEVADLIMRAALAAIESGGERITFSTVMALGNVPLSR